MLDDIRQFHEKFELKPCEDGHRLDAALQHFRLKFLVEELLEYCHAVGYELSVTENGVVITRMYGDCHSSEDAFDALIDLTYVTLGTSYLHDFPFREGWSRVHEKNMQKIRVSRLTESKRGSKFDVVKPPGWTPPRFHDLLKR